jgi:hypothetical protein
MSEHADYLGGVAAMMTCLVFVILLGLYVYDKRNPLPACDEYASSGRSILSIQFPVSANTVLLCTRTVSFLWWFGVGWVAKWIRDAPLPRYYMFTVWNIILMSIYFLCASICSWQYNRDPTNADSSFPSWWRLPFRNAVAAFVRIGHSVIGGCALFVTISAWKGSLGFWGLQQHLTNVLVFVVEGAQVVYAPHSVHFFWTGAFLYTYVCFVWIIVKAWGGQGWPYPFLETKGSEGTVFGGYLAVLGGNIATFTIWLVLARGKIALYSCVFGKDFSPPTLAAVAQGSTPPAVECTDPMNVHRDEAKIELTVADADV